MDLGGGVIRWCRPATAGDGRPDRRSVPALAALQATEDLAERGPQVRGIERIQDVPHRESQGTRLVP